MHFARMRRAAMLMVAIIGFTAVSLAQQTVTGTVTDKKGEPVPGVTVTVKGTKNATSTNNKGVYTLSNVAADAVLKFTGAGLASREVNLSGKSVINTELEASVSSMSEVVVVGYGTRKIKDLTGSVAALSTKDFNKGLISTPEQLIQGRTPGVTITPSSGEPGAASTINIRGTSSIRGNNDPLYVVDGVPLDGGGTSGSASGVEGSSTPKNPLLFLNPNDIESISILKDASSAAIYGSRGANGVVIITTKIGRSKKGAFTFGSTTSVSKTASRYDLLKAPDFLSAVRKANIDAGTTIADAAAAVLNVDKGYNTNWQDQIFQTGVSQNYNLAWGFANKGTALRASGSYDDQVGTVKTSGLKRITGRLNFSQKFLNDKVKYEASFIYSNIKNKYAPNTNNAGYQGSLIGAAIAFNPTYPVYNADGTFFDPGDGNRNPAEMLAYFDDKDNINRILTNQSLSVQLAKGLTYKGTFGYSNSKSVRTSFADPRLGSNAFGGNVNVWNVDYGNPIYKNGRAVQQDLKSTSILVEHTLTYDKSFDNGSELNVIGGYSYQSYENTGSANVSWGLNSPVANASDIFVKDINNFKTKKLYYLPYNNKSELQSVFGRLTYSIKNKYYFNATVRVDGSSQFGTDNKYGTFPAFAAKWKLLNEEFAAKSLGKVFSEFSIRAGYGILGSQDGLDPYSAKGHLVIKPQGDTANVLVANKKLKWEQGATTGAGFDFAFKGIRLSGTVDYYSTKRSNLIYQNPTSGGYSATPSYFSNLDGYVLNTGWEFSLNYQAIKAKNFSWDINYNMTFLHNEVRDLKVTVNTGVVNGQGLSGAYAQTITTGYSLYTWKMPVFAGFDGNGDQRFANNDPGDKLLGSALPTFTAGLTNSFSLGKWNASFFLNTTRGFYVYNNTANALFLKGSVKTAHNITYAVANSNEDPINPGSVSSRFLEKGDFVRLSNAVISYNFELKNKFVKTLTASVSGQNLLLFTAYTGLDPEVNVDKNINGVPSRGFDYAGYPKARTISLGINLGF